MKKILIIDSSVIVKLVNAQNEQHIEKASEILKDAQNNKIDLYTSELAKYEVGNALLKRKQLELPQAYTSLATIHDLPITFVSESEDLAKSTYQIGKHVRITYYDAAFLSLAKKYEAPLVTDNIKHQGKALEVQVIPLSRYK